ncbi:predicted protein [Nematostella vectensis]|uniref:D-isomer specific 2-hydroxyacid dehydrogenase NAD-binding domain-containing protein n=1 Tax=Nematostella vectensis TaxID=45351 RepID=A7S1G9_NEMVE|nr:predicted protein [Nematostella vectensis]|eukprot:XP_001634520.1 predicted protein [Nematostella vectensis]
MGRIVHVFSEIENILVELNRACPTVEFVQVDSSGARNEVISKLEKAEVLLGDSHILSDYPNYLPNLKWLQLTFAGVDAVIKSLAAPPKFIITRFGGVLGHYMAEYVIGQVIAREKDFLLMARNQEKRIWLQNVSCRSLHGLNLGILGIGEIGKELARVAKTFGMITWGMGRTPRNTPPANVDKYITPNSLEDLLCSCHYICNILPSTPSTRYLLSGDVLKKCMNNKPVL